MTIARADDGSYLLTLAVDPAVLDAATYPVYLDPSPADFPNGSSTSDDTFASQANPTSNFNNYAYPNSPGYHEMWHGLSPDEEAYNEIYIRFNGLATAIGSGAHIDSASLQMYPHWQYYTSSATLIDRVSSSWSASTLTWNNRPTIGPALSGSFSTTQGTMSAFDVKSYVQDVVDGDWTDNGLRLDGEGLGTTGWKRFISSGEASSHPTWVPTLTVAWHTITGTPSTPTAGAVASRTLTWSYSAGTPAFTQSSYWVQVSTSSSFSPASTIVRETGDATNRWLAGSAASWTFPVSGTAMTEGATYYWRVRVSDGSAKTAWSSAASFTLDTTAPTVDFQTPDENATVVSGYPYTMAWTENGTGSSIASRSRTRELAPVVSAGVCPSSGWAPDVNAPSTSTSPISITSIHGLVSGYAYRWTQSVTDDAGNIGSSLSGCLIIDTAGTGVNFTTPDEGTTSVSALPYTIAWNESAPGSSVASRGRTRERSLVTTDGVCPTAGWESDSASASTGASPVSATSASGLVSGYAYRWTQSVTDAAGHTGSSLSGCLIVDTTAPTVDFQTPNEGATVLNSTGEYTIAWTEYGTGSTIASRSRARQSATIGAGSTCPTADSAWTTVSTSTTASPAVATGASALPSGSAYRWIETVTDAAGNSGSTTSGCVIVDSSGPAMSLDTPANRSILTGSPTSIVGTITAASGTTWTLATGTGPAPTTWTTLATGTLPTQPSASWTTTLLEGVYSVRLTSTISGVSRSVTSTVYVANGRRGNEPYYTRVPFEMGGGWNLAVGVANGELTLDRSLFEIPSYGPPQTLVLSYSSVNTSSAGLFGPGWSSNLTQYLTFEGDFVVWHRADGGLVPFVMVNGSWTPSAGHYETLALASSEYTITSKDQSKLVFESTGSGRLKRITNRFGKSLTLSWTANTATDASGRATSLTVSSGKITGVTDSAGRSWSFGYDGSGYLTSVTDPLSQATTLAYTGGVLTSIARTRSNAASTSSTITWTVAYSSGNVSAVKDPISTGPTNTFTYGSGTTTVGLLKDYTGPVLNTWTYTLDPFGRSTTVVDPENNTTEVAFDPNGNVTSQTLPIDATRNQVINYSWDSRGNVLSETTQLDESDGVVTRMTYNAVNDVVTISEADNDAAVRTITYYSYDLAGHLAGIVANCTNSGTTPPSTAGTCRALGTSNESTNIVTSYTYTANDQIDTEANPGQTSTPVVTKHNYETYGNETSTVANYAAGQSATADRNVTTSYAFNQSTTAGKAGLPTSTTDPLGNVTTRSYDALGRQTSVTLPSDTSIAALTTTTAYDSFDNVLTETDSWTGVTRTTTHDYDAMDRATTVTDAAGFITTTIYDAAGNAKSTTSAGVTTSREFDGLGQVVCERLGSSTCSVLSPAVATLYEYDAQSRIVEKTDPQSVTATATYDLAGRVKAEGVAETQMSFVYDAVGRETSNTPSGQATTTTTYDRLGRTISTAIPGATTLYEYDRAGNQTSETSPDSSKTTTQYDTLGRATVVVLNDVSSPNSATQDVTTTSYYDAAGNEIATRDSRGFTTRSIYNARGFVIKTIANCTDSGTTPTSSPASCIGAGTHDATTNVVTTIDYEPSGAVIKVVTAEGSGTAEATVEYAYDAAGRRQAVKDPLGTVTRTIYDGYGRVSSTIVNCTESTSSPVPPSANWWTCDGSSLADATWNVTSSKTYDSHGNVATETAPNGRVTTNVYDSADRLDHQVENDVATATAADQDVTTYYAYDEAGRQSAILAPTSDQSHLTATRYKYNEQGQLETEIRNCIQSGTSGYASTGAWSTCDPGTSSTYDTDTNLITTYAYDNRGNKVSVTVADPSSTATGVNAPTVTTRYAFDAENRLCRVLENATVDLATLADPCTTSVSGTESQNVSTRYSYDGMGNLASMIDGRGNITRYGYDSAGHMTSLTDEIGTDPNNAGKTTVWTFDALDRRTAQTQRGTQPQSALVTWAYDATSRLVGRTANSATTAYGYDDNGNRTSAASAAGTISATYDRLNRPLSVSDSADSGAATSYTYSLTSPSWSDPSGSYTATLDKFDRQVELADPVHGSTHFTFSYRADDQTATVGAPNGNTTTFAYDGAGSSAGKTTAGGGINRAVYAWTRNRGGNVLSEVSTITGDTTNGTTSFTYDQLGRLTGATRSTTFAQAYTWQHVANRASFQVGTGTPVTTSYDAANRPDSTGYVSDSEGRLTARPGQVVEWDDLGRLTKVKNSSTSAEIAAYTYDALDRLLTAKHGSVTNRFRYVGLTAQVAQVVTDSTSASLYKVANGWDGEQLFEWTSASQAFYGTNGHHDVTWTAGSSGTVGATLRYDAWGNLLTSTGTLPEFRFQGSWYDATADLSWIVARWYAPSMGRFISEDSLLGQSAQPASRHLYAYAQGEPVGHWDPTGTSTRALSWSYASVVKSNSLLGYSTFGKYELWNRDRGVIGGRTDAAVLAFWDDSVLLARITSAQAFYVQADKPISVKFVDSDLSWNFISNIGWGSTNNQYKVFLALHGPRSIEWRSVLGRRSACGGSLKYFVQCFDDVTSSINLRGYTASFTSYTSGYYWLEIAMMIHAGAGQGAQAITEGQFVANTIQVTW
jgi:RHS repeat-associated protein